MPPRELAETVLEESGYVRMWQEDRSLEAPGRLENLKELVQALAEFETLAGSSSMSAWSWTTPPTRPATWSP